jgi:hypothetical protein
MLLTPFAKSVSCPPGGWDRSGESDNSKSQQITGNVWILNTVYTDCTWIILLTFLVIFVVILIISGDDVV